jgi:hypothetical protein
MDYMIEDDIDFFAELNKPDHAIPPEQEDHLCLITHEPLSDKFVTLKCGHKFNYVPLYNDLIRHKTKFNKKETTKCNKKQIRCPYCRNVQSQLLPYYPQFGFPPVDEVTYADEHYICAYDCHPLCNNLLRLKQICYIIIRKNEPPTNFGDTHFYCTMHRNIMQKKYLTQFTTDSLKQNLEAKISKINNMKVSEKNKQTKIAKAIAQHNIKVQKETDKYNEYVKKQNSKS